MAEQWQTIEQAAVSLRMSVRTVNRHISANKLESRLKDGRREVLVSLPDTPQSEQTASSPFSSASVSTDTAGQPTAAESSSAEGHPAAATGPAVDPVTVLAMADKATQKAELAVNAYQMLARTSDVQLRQVRRNARLAWAAVVLMAAGVTVAVGWTTHRLTRATGDVAHLQDQLHKETLAVQTLSADQEQLRTERLEVERTLRDEMAKQAASATAERAAAELSLRNEVTAAREQAAEAEGALAAFRERDEIERAIAVAASGTDKLSATDIPAPAETVASHSPAPATTQPTPEVQTVAKAGSSPTVPTTRPVASRRKANAPTTRPAQSDSIANTSSEGD